MKKKLPFLTKGFGRKQLCLIAMLISGGVMEATAQEGYTYRTRVASGNWDTYTTWERALNGTTSFVALKKTQPIPNNAAGTITIRSGHKINVNKSKTVDQVTVEAGATLTVNATQTLTIADGTANGYSASGMTVNGTVDNFGTVSVTSASGLTLNFAANSTYKHTRNTSTDWGSIPTAIWDATSTLDISYAKSTAPSLTGLNQNFGNVKWSTPNLAANLDLAGILATVQGDLEITSTGKSLILSSNGNYTLNVGRDLIISNPLNKTTRVVFSAAGAPATGTLELNIGRNLSVASKSSFINESTDKPMTAIFKGTGTLSAMPISAMDLEISEDATITLANNLEFASNFKVLTGGTLNTGIYELTGSGHFSVADNATLSLGHEDGLLGNIKTTGVNTYGPSAIFVYEGATAQKTGTGSLSTLGSLIINNANGVSLTSDLSINNSLYLQSGSLMTQTNKLIINEGGTVIKDESAGFIDGGLSYRVSTTQAQNLFFPTGRGSNYRPVRLKFTQSTSENNLYTVTQVEGNPDISKLPNNFTVSNSRYYSITQTSGYTSSGRTSSTATAITDGEITLTYGSNDGVNYDNTLQILKTDNTSWNWNDLEKLSMPNGNGVSEITSKFTSLGEDDVVVLANENNGNSLPVELVSFNAEKVNGTVKLMWKTAAEKDNDFFAVERSANGIDFLRIDRVQGAGTSAESHAYSATDMAPLAGTSYYRLAQTDFDGTITYSRHVLACGNCNV